MCLSSLLGACLALGLGGSGFAQDSHDETEASFIARCKAASAEVCLPLNSEQEVTRYRESPSGLSVANLIRWDPLEKAARFTVPPSSPADSSGQLHIPFPRTMQEVYFSFDVRYPSDFLRHRFKGSGGWKMFILGQGRQGCAPFEIVGVNGFYRSYPNFYYMCGVFHGVDMPNPMGDNNSQFDYQPGGDTACLRHQDPRSKPCAGFEPDRWVTYQVHVSTAVGMLEVWQTVRGKTLKIIEYRLEHLPVTMPGYEWLKLTPYNTNKDASEIHPSFSLWYRRLIVSNSKIGFPKLSR